MNTQYTKLLAKHQLRVTPARLEVLQVLRNEGKPVDINCIWKKMGENGVEVDQATVYRIIEAFKIKGFVNQIDLREGKYRYELAGKHHHHLKCNQCGEITPIFDECIRVSEESILKRYNFLVTDHSLEFFGACTSCSSEGNL